MVPAVLCIFITIVVCGLMYVTFFHHESSFVTYIYHWDYRVLIRLRSEYRWGIIKTPPDSYEYFCDKAINYIERYLAEHKGLIETQKEREGKAINLVKMLCAQQFIHHYFTEYDKFTGSVYYLMFIDFRSGVYNQRDYSSKVALRKKLPLAIKSSDKAFESFIKFVNAGWFDINSGMYIVGGEIEKQHIGRAIYWICHRCGIPSPEKVFAPFWNEKESTVTQWCRVNHRAPERTKQIDKMVDTILGMNN